VLRLVKALAFTDEHGEVCPASWTPGSATMVPDHNSPALKNFWKDVHSKK
jgi:peroxiredoxin (alkyl hydroperoxide reductase subunit C)